MSIDRNRAVRGFRERLKRDGLVRCEVTVRRGDVELVRTVAAALRDPEREVSARATLRERFGAVCGRGFKALLAACPLEDVDLVRPRDVARGVGLRVPRGAMGSARKKETSRERH